MAKKRTHKYPDDWSKADLAAFVKEEQEMKETFVAKSNALEAEVTRLRWQMDRLRELLALATRIAHDLSAPLEAPPHAAR